MKIKFKTIKGDVIKYSNGKDLIGIIDIPVDVTHLDISTNQLNSLPILPPNLIELLSYGNKIIELPNVLPDS